MPLPGMACPPDCSECATTVKERRTQEDALWAGLVEAFERICQTPREPGDQARNLLAFLRMGYEVTERPEMRIK